MVTRERFDSIKDEWEALPRPKHCSHRWTSVDGEKAFTGCVDCGWVVRRSDGDPGPIVQYGQ